jgi:hypothetical protein
LEENEVRKFYINYKNRGNGYLSRLIALLQKFREQKLDCGKLERRLEMDTWRWQI